MHSKYVLLLCSAMSFLFLFGLASIYFSHHLAKIIKSIDLPDDVRKAHTMPTPSTGGIGIFLTFMLGLLIAFLQPVYEIPREFISFAPYFIISIFVIVGTGFYDDLKGLSSKPKFTFQIIASIIILVGLDQTLLPSISYYAELSVLPKILLYSVFLFWIVANCNAVNLIDGVDGLAGSIAVTILAGLCVLAYYWGQYAAILLLLPLVGAILPFLIFNRPPASIFMGDTGSLLIGFVMPVVAIIIGLNSPHWSCSIIFIALFGVPLLDTSTSIIRRIRMGINIFESDNNHAHHVIQRKYKSPGTAVLALVTVSLMLQGYGLWLATLPVTIKLAVAYGFFGLSTVSFIVYYCLNLMDKNSYFRMNYISENNNASVNGDVEESDKKDKELKKSRDAFIANHVPF